MSPANRAKTSSGRKPPALAAGVEHLQQGFYGHSEAKVPFGRLHSHDDIEISINEHHPVVAIFGDQRITLPPDHLLVFWASRPHGPIETTAGGWAHDIHLPLSWVLQWQLPTAFIRLLLTGRVLLDAPGPRPADDLELVKSWVALMQQESEECHRIVLLEVEARLRRLAMDVLAREGGRKPAPEPVVPSRGSLGRFEKMATLIAKHCREPLSIEDIAEAVHMKPPAAMRLFRKFSGMTLHECLTQHRVSYSQRLLATTDAKIDDIAARSGFGSPARFYASFRELTGRSPAAYRRLLKQGG